MSDTTPTPAEALALAQLRFKHRECLDYAKLREWLTPGLASDGLSSANPAKAQPTSGQSVG